ncbi:MAG: hypothetical protein ACOC8X_00740 [Chloroflexota bacterium]
MEVYMLKPPKELWCHLPWIAFAAMAAGVLWTVGILLTWLDPDGFLPARRGLVAISLLLVLPLFVTLPVHLLCTRPIVAYGASLVAGGALLFSLIGIVNVLAPQSYLPQPGWFTWDAFIMAFKVWGLIAMLAGVVAFWKRPGFVAAATVVTGVFTYHFAGTLDGGYPAFWQFAVAAGLGASWVVAGVALYRMEQRSPTYNR